MRIVIRELLMTSYSRLLIVFCLRFPILLYNIKKTNSMIRLYDLVKRHGSSVLICEVRRFLRDMPCVLSHSFDTGTTSITAPASWTTQERTDCYRQFDELLRSPHWLAEIQPCMKHYNDDYLFPLDEFSL